MYVLVIIVVVIALLCRQREIERVREKQIYFLL